VKWRPASLFARSTVLIVVLLGASQAANLLMFREFVQKPRLERMADYIRDHVATIRLALAGMDATQRARYLAALDHAMPHAVLDDAGATAALSHPAPRGITLLLDPIARNLGPAYQVRWQNDASRRLWVRADLAGRPAWIGFSTAGLLPNLSLLLAITSLVTLALALVGAWWIHRLIHLPMQRLSRAMDALGQGTPPPALPRDAPSEIATVMRRFEQTAARLAQAERDRALMLAGVSHDLRTPLAKLRLGVELLGDDTPADIRDTMTRSIASADAIIGQFVAFARIGHDEPLQRIALAALLDDAVAELGGDAHVQRPITPVPDVAVRAVALKRAVVNLLENARRHGGGEISLRLGTRDGLAVISVLDRGPGLDAVEREAVLRPFVRGDAANGSGSGLGLAIVQRIAGLHGGRLELRPRPGGGLEAHLWLDVLPPRA
jgi:two-component system osmolarity sensor histidine kinase EnvZ